MDLFFRVDNADRRRQIIEESKYLGGDLEHTHLVKGLDYALLQKIKAENEKIEYHHGEVEDDEDDEDQEQPQYNEQIQSSKTAVSDDEQDEEQNESEKLKFNLKPKLLNKTTTASLAAALNKTLETPFAFKKYLFFLLEEHIK
jgi:hypothetical protein